MENKTCKSLDEIEELIKVLQTKNPHYTRDEIEKAIQQCCKVEKNPNDNLAFLSCVEEFTKNFHLINFKK